MRDSPVTHDMIQSHLISTLFQLEVLEAESLNRKIRNTKRVTKLDLKIHMKDLLRLKLIIDTS